MPPQPLGIKGVRVIPDVWHQRVKNQSLWYGKTNSCCLLFINFTVLSFIYYAIAGQPVWQNNNLHSFLTEVKG
jgi:hypothetical protein